MTQLRLRKVPGRVEASHCDYLSVFHSKRIHRVRKSRKANASCALMRIRVQF
jgi:hypothetical protein